MVQRRLEFLKAVRFGRFVSNELVWRASCEGLHNLGRIFIFRQILENQTCDPASAGFFEGRQIWADMFQTDLFGRLHGKAYIVWAAY